MWTSNVLNDSCCYYLKSFIAILVANTQRPLWQIHLAVRTKDGWESKKYFVTSDWTWIGFPSLSPPTYLPTYLPRKCGKTYSKRLTKIQSYEACLKVLKNMKIPTTRHKQHWKTIDPWCVYFEAANTHIILVSLSSTRSYLSKIIELVLNLKVPKGVHLLQI